MTFLIFNLFKIITKYENPPHHSNVGGPFHHKNSILTLSVFKNTTICFRKGQGRSDREKGRKKKERKK